MKKTNEKGVTLISLIITIIILLILLGLIELIVPDDLFKKIDDAEKYTIGVIDDSQTDVNQIKNDIPNITNDVVAGDINNAPTVTAEHSNVTQEAATITAIGQDADGDLLEYALVINETEISYELSTNNVWNISGLTANTKYTYTVTVSDGKATSTDSGEFTTKSEEETNTPPVIKTNELNEKDTTWFKIYAMAEDADGDQLTYILYTSESENGTYSEADRTESPVASGTTVDDLTKAGLVQYTTYWWYITVTDTAGNTVTSDKQSVKTYCPGPITCSKGYQCTAQGTAERPCEYCDGTGIWTGSDGTNSECGATITQELDVGATYADIACSKCGSQNFYEVIDYCPNYSECGLYWEGLKCMNCGEFRNYSAEHKCTGCGGDGKESYTTACGHGNYSPHYYCDTHQLQLSNTTTHTVSCAHSGATGKHDD